LEVRRKRWRWAFVWGPKRVGDRAQRWFWAPAMSFE
jgi:hypothetical protein